MQKGGNPHSFLDWSQRVLLRETGFLCGVVRKFECSIKKFSQINFFANRLLGGCGLTRLEEIAAPDFYRRKSHNLRDAIHMPLHREQTLWRAKPSKCPVRRSICRHGLPTNADIGPIIGTTRVNCAPRQDYGRQRRVCAAINREVDLSAQNLSVLADRGAVTRARRMTLRSRRHAFQAVIDDFHRASRLHGEKRRVARNYRGIIFLASESAPGLSLHHTNFLCQQIAQRHQRLMYVIRTLQRTPHRNSLLAIEDRNYPVVFDVKLLLRTRGVLAFNDVVGLCPNAIDIALRDQESFECIVHPPNDLGTPFAFFNGKNGRQWFVFDRDAIHSLSQEMRIRMRQEQDRFLGMIDLSIRQARLIVSDQSDAILAWNILRRDHYKFAPLELRIKRNVFDYTPRNLAANRRAVEHPRHGHVVDVPRRAGHFVAALLARHRLANNVLCHAQPFISHLAMNLPSSCLVGKLSIPEDAQTAQIRRPHYTPQLFSQIRGDGVPIMQPIFGHDELRFWFEDHEVSIKSFRNAAFASGAPSE